MDEKLALREQGLGHVIPLKTAEIEYALSYQVGNLHVNCQHSYMYYYYYLMVLQCPFGMRTICKML